MVQISLFDFESPPDPISGEAFTLSPLDAIILPVGGLLKTPITQISKFFTNIFKAPVTTTISTSIKNLGLQAARNSRSITPTVSPSSKALIGAGIVGTTATTGFLTLTPGGINLVNTGGDIAKDAANIGEGITEFFQVNPALLLGLIALGFFVVVKK